MDRVEVEVGTQPKAKKVKNAADVEEVDALPVKKVRRKTGSGLMSGSPFDLPLELKQALWKQGVDLCWVLDTVIGADFHNITNTFYNEGGWEPVTTKMFRGQLANRWTPAGHVGTIHHGGQILCWRTREESEEAAREQLAAARQPIDTTRRNFKNRQVPGLSQSGQTPQAQAVTGIVEEYARIPD